MNKTIEIRKEEVQRIDQRKHSSIADGCANIYSYYGNQYNGYSVIENLSISSTATSLLGLYTKDAPPYHKEACSIMFIVTLIINPEI